MRKFFLILKMELLSVWITIKKYTGENILMKQLEKILKNWQDFLGLQHWSLIIIIKKLEDAEDGEIDYDNREFTGTIFLQEGQSIEKYEETIVHELLHLIFEEIDHIVDQLREKDNSTIVDLYDVFLHKA